MPAWVDIVLDKPRKLRYRHNDIADMEQATGRGFQDLLVGMQFHGARTLLSYGLRWMDRTMTPVKAGDLIQDHWIETGHTLDDLADVLLEALESGGLTQKKAAVVDEGNAQPEAVTDAASGSTATPR